MTFSFPSAENSFAVAPASNSNHVATVGAPTSAGVKTAGGLPITSNVGDWERDDIVNGLQGYVYSFGSAQDVSTDTVLLLWHNQSNAPNRIQKDSVANDGNVIRVYTGSGSPSTNYRHFRVGGNDTPMCSNISGQYPVVIDLNSSGHDTSSGTFDNTDVTQFAWLCEPFSMAGTNTMWNYPGQCYLLNTTKGGTNTPTFSGTSDFDDAVDQVAGTDYTDKIGQWVRQIGTVYFIDMPFQIGNNSTETDFNDNGVTVISPVDNDSGDPRNRLTDQAMRTYLNLRNNAADTATFSGTYIWGTRADFDWDQDDSAVVTFNSPTFRGMGTFTLGSSITGPAVFQDVDPVVFADTGVDIDGSTFRSPNGSYALEMTAGAMDIADMRFESYSGSHAILIDTAGTYNFDNVFFDESGTNEIETTHASGTVTINISNGGTVPGVTERALVPWLLTITSQWASL